MNNPFVINDYAGAELFCGREEETALMIKYLTNGHNMVLISPRRIGKTGLISHVFAQPQIKDNYITVNVDIYSTKSFNEFVAYLGSAITDALKPKGKVWINRFIGFLTSLKSQMTFDMNGFPIWNLGVGEGVTPDLTLDEIFSYLRESDTPIIIAIDEFQQITRYSDAWKVEALLRTHIQHCGNTRFIFVGSHRHLMAEIFNSPSRPFYSSSMIMNLSEIPVETYDNFCRRLFFERGAKTLLPGVTQRVYNIFRGVTAPMHWIMNVMYANTVDGGICDLPQIDTAIDEILRLKNDAYVALRYQLSQSQYALLYAIAKEGQAKNIQSAAFIKKHRLAGSSSVNGAARVLLDRDFITRFEDTYAIYDPFFEIWLSRQQF